MHVIAITRLGTSIELEAKALAADLGALPYDQRQKLAPGLPAIVLTTPDEHRAATLATALRGRGHEVVQVCGEDVVASADMVELRRFRFDDDALVSTTTNARLPWADIAIILPAVHRTTVDTKTQVKTKELALGRAVLTGGLVTRKTTSQSVSARRDDVENVAYLVPRGGAKPWFLCEHGTHFDALGADVTTASAQNVTRVIDAIRGRAPTAAFDEKLMTRKGAASDIDLLAHVIMRAVASAPG